MTDHTRGIGTDASLGWALHPAWPLNSDMPVEQLPRSALMGLQACALRVIATSHWTEGFISEPARRAQLIIDIFFAV